MSAIFILIPLSLVIATVFLIAFIWAVRSGQYDDTCTPSMRVLLDDVTKAGADPKAEGRGGNGPAGQRPNQSSPNNHNRVIRSNIPSETGPKSKTKPI